MSIEVRQMIVKTSVVSRPALDEPAERQPLQQLPPDEMRKVLDACRRMVAEMLRERRER